MLSLSLCVCVSQAHCRVDLLYGGAESPCAEVRPGHAAVLCAVSVGVRRRGPERAGAGEQRLPLRYRGSPGLLRQKLLSV